MEYYDQEYLNLFKQIRQEKQETKDFTFEQLKNNTANVNNYQMLKETPNYDNYTNINEVQRQPYSFQDMNLNEFNIETRINGQNVNEFRREEKQNRLNEVMQNLRQDRIKAMEVQSINEKVSFENADVVTLEMFEKARYNSMMTIANRILPK